MSSAAEAESSKLAMDFAALAQVPQVHGNSKAGLAQVDEHWKLRLIS